MAKLDCAMTMQENEDLQRGYRKLEKKMCDQKLLLADLQVLHLNMYYRRHLVTVIGCMVRLNWTTRPRRTSNY
jgi:hypothetical protein